MLLWLHIALVLLLLVLLCLNLSRKNGSKICMMLIRVLYILFIIDGICLVPKAWERNAILTVVKILASVGLIGFLEFIMAQRMKNKMSSQLILALVIVLVAFIILGLFTAGFRPWIHL